MSEIEQQTKDILGYGEELEVLIGVDSDTGEKKFKIYHFTPVPLKLIPNLMKSLDVFFKASEKNEWSEAVIDKSASIIKMSLIKMHPNIDNDEIKSNFGLGALAKGISIVMDVNDFLSQMQKMTQKMGLMGAVKQ